MQAKECAYHLGVRLEICLLLIHSASAYWVKCVAHLMLGKRHVLYVHPGTKYTFASQVPKCIWWHDMTAHSFENAMHHHHHHQLKSQAALITVPPPNLDLHTWYSISPPCHGAYDGCTRRRGVVASKLRHSCILCTFPVLCSMRVCVSVYLVCVSVWVCECVSVWVYEQRMNHCY